MEYVCPGCSLVLLSAKDGRIRVPLHPNCHRSGTEHVVKAPAGISRRRTVRAAKAAAAKAAKEGE